MGGGGGAGCERRRVVGWVKTSGGERESVPILPGLCLYFFFFNDTATTEIYTLSLHDVFRS